MSRVAEQQSHPRDEGSGPRDIPGLELLSRLHAAAYVAEAGAQGAWTYVDPQIEDILGFTADEVIADPGLWARQLHPDDRDRVLAETEEARAGAVLAGYREYRMVRKDGRVVWVLDGMTRSPGRGDRTTHHGLLYDITGRKTAELLLAQHLRIVERVARGDDLVLTLAELAGAAEAVTGGRVAHVVVDSEPTTGGRLVVSSSGPVADGEVWQSADTRVPIHCRSGERLGELLLSPGGEGHGLAQGRSGDEGRALAWVGRLAATAVSRVVQDARMESSLSLLEATLESTADGILVVDSQGRIVGYNQTFRRMWRIPQKVLDDRDDRKAIEYVLAQLSDPRRFVSEVDRLYSSPEEASFDVLRFLDGRVFERYSQPQRVGGRSVGRVWSFRDVTSYRRLESRLRYAALTDPLTSLPNRALLTQRLTTALESQRTHRRPGSHGPVVLLLDIDDFKTVNDGLGYVAGDQLLEGIAERLVGVVRPNDTAARLGGDEFVVLVEDVTDLASMRSLARRMLDEVRRPIEVDGHSVAVRASVGIARAEPGLSAGDILRNADLAMYTVKRRGGAGYSMFHPDMHAQAVSRLALKEDLGRALDRAQLRVEYQPVVRLDTFYIVGAEALARWDHPVRGTVSPVEFIPLAEETGLIDEIGRWVLRQACAQATSWRARQGMSAPNLFMSVNVSPRQLANPLFVPEVRDVLAETGQPASNLVLEITEGALAQPVADAARALSELKDLGVRLALDDFGTSHSSLGRLDDYHLDVMKIDKTFVDRLENDSGGIAFTEAIMALAQALGLGVVAEGVETDKQLRLLSAVGCQLGQGFLFSEPVPAERFSLMLKHRVVGVQGEDAGYGSPG